MKKDSKVVTYALITPIINNMVSLMMGIVTFSTSFDYLTRHNPEMTQTGKYSEDISISRRLSNGTYRAFM